MQTGIKDIYIFYTLSKVIFFCGLRLESDRLTSVEACGSQEGQKGAPAWPGVHSNTRTCTRGSPGRGDMVGMKTKLILDIIQF